MFSAKRRLLLKSSLYSGMALLYPVFSKAAHSAGLAEAFSAKPYADILKKLFSTRAIIETDLLKISLPQIVENGAAAPITISSNLDNIQRIYILVEKNPTPLAAEFTFSSELAVYITTRIKMAESSHVVIIAEQGNQLLSNQQWVNVVLGGCGSG